MSSYNKHRRRFLGLLGGSSVLVLAGCIGDDDDDDDTEESDDADDDDTVEPDDDDNGVADDDDDDDDDETAAEHIDEAVAELQSALDLLIETIDDDDLQLEVEQFAGYLENAVDALNAAEPLATADEQDDIEELRAFAEYVSLRGDAEQAVDVGFEEHMGAGLTQYWAGRDEYDRDEVSVAELDAAADRFEEAEVEFEDAQAAFDEAASFAMDAEDVLSDLPETVTDWFDDVEYAELVEEVEGFIWFMGEMEPFTTATADGSRAWYHVSKGFLAFEQEEWAEGESEFGMANSSFDTAVAELESVHPDVRGGMEAFFEEMLCEIEAGPDASAYWHEAAQAALDDDEQTHEDAIDAGWDLIVECHEP